MEQSLITMSPKQVEEMTSEEKMRTVALFTMLSREERLEHFGFDKQIKLAEVLQITEKTISVWKNKTPKFKKIRQQLLIETSIERRLPSILNKLVERAEVDGDVAAIKEILKITEITKDKLEIINDQRIYDILGQVVVILQEEIDDKSLLNRIAERIGEIDV